MNERITGKIAEVIGNCEFIINKGSNDGLSLNENILLYHEDEELFDPVSKQSLGNIEIPYDYGKIIKISANSAIVKVKSSKNEASIARGNRLRRPLLRRKLVRKNKANKPLEELLFKDAI